MLPKALTDTKTIWLLFFIAAISFIFTLNLPSIGEEGVYTISSFEMWYNKHYLYPLFYGTAYGRPPFFNWLIVLVIKIIGQSHVLISTRLVTAAATISTGLVLAWLTQNIFHNKNFAAFSALAYLTTDALLYHGWLAYADPLFAFCIFSAIACLWVACELECLWLLVIAIIALTAGFLTKALTAYTFYLTAFAVLLFLNKRKFLLGSISIILHLIALSAPLVWAIITHNANGNNLIHDVFYWSLNAEQGDKISTYLIQLVLFLIEIIIRILPVSILAIYYFWRNHNKIKIENKAAIKFLLLFIIIGLFPYLIAAKHSARYILPLYPFIALLCSYIIWYSDNNLKAVRIALLWFIATIIIKYLSVIFWWPNYQAYYRGDYAQVARDITQRIGNKYQVYVVNTGATEHSIFNNINIIRYPLAPVKHICLRPHEENDYFIFTTDGKINHSKIAQEYTLGKSDRKFYLLCYGKACS